MRSIKGPPQSSNDDADQAVSSSFLNLVLSDPPRPGSLKRFPFGALVAGTAVAGCRIAINDFGQGLNLCFSEGVFDDKIAAQIKKIFFLFVHISSNEYKS